MSLRRGADGRFYGTIEVLLIRIVDDETETLIGTASPFGGIMVEDYDGRCWAEEPASWWETQGFTITEPAILAEVRRAVRAPRPA